MVAAKALTFAQRPATARLRFKLRSLTNFVWVVAIFSGLALVFRSYEWAWIADLVAIAILFYFYFFILEKRAIGMYCNHCGKYITSNTPWICGHCNAPNTNASEYPLVDKCGQCQDEPKAYR